MVKACHLRADNRARTGDLNLGKVALYQLSYVRENASAQEARCACVQTITDLRDRSPTGLRSGVDRPPLEPGSGAFRGQADDAWRPLPWPS